MSINSFNEIENIRTSFIADNSNKQTYLSELREEFNKEFVRIDALINEIKVSINNIIDILKQQNININYDINKYDQISFNDLIIKNITHLKGLYREKIKCKLIKIEKTWNDINNLLETINLIQEKQIKIVVPEKDIDDELVIDLNMYRKEEKQNKYILFKIPDNVSLKDIVKHVYGSSDYLYPLYEYGCNKIYIDDIVNSNNFTLDEVLTSNQLLNGLFIQFPNTLNKGVNEVFRHL